MKNRIKTVLITVLVFVSLIGVANADILDRIGEQQQRIDNGIAKGQLTRGEADTLQDNLNWIKMTYSKLREDGRLNASERQSLNRMLDENNDMIYKRKHNIRKVYDYSFNDRIAEQQRRIDQGIASGTLTRREFEILQDNLNWIKMRAAEMESAGRLTPYESEKLTRMLDRNSRMIANKKQNAIGRVY